MLPVGMLLAVFLVVMFLPLPRSTAEQLPSSGDALYDALAAIVNGDLQSNDYRLLVPDDYIADSSLHFAAEPGRISLEAVRGLREGFGDDPRYWQLSWLLRVDGSAADYDRAALYHSPAFDEAWADGLRDEGCDYLRLLEATDAERPAIVAAALASHPHNSFWHYEAARLALQSRDREGFVHAMQAGNAATHNERPRPWPLGLLAADSRLPSDQDSLAVQGVLAQLARSQREGALRSAPGPLDLWDAAELDADTVDAFVLMQTRIAGMQGNGLLQLWQPAMQLSQLLGNPRLGTNWTATQKARLEIRRAWARELAGLEQPAMFGAAAAWEPSLADTVLPDESGNAGAANLIWRDQASWIHTLQSWRLDQQRAAAAAGRFRDLLDCAPVPLRIDR